MHKSLTFLIATAALAAPAHAATLRLVLSGTAFDGPPAYVLTRGDTVVAEGTVENAIDSGAGIPQTNALAQTGKTVEIDLSDLTANAADLELRFTNDKWAGPGIPGDRNLYVLSASIDDQPIPLDQVTLISEGSTVTAPVSDNGILVLFRTNDVAIFPFMATSATQRTAAATPAPAEVPPEAEGQPLSDDTPEAVVQGAAETAPESVTQAAPPDVPTAPVCTVAAEAIVAEGFSINSAVVPPDALDPLRELAARTDLSDCELTVTGYASLSGPAAWNVRLAGLRAEAVTKVLTDAGVNIAVETIVGGQTDQFGPTVRDNQRVVVSISP